MTTCSTTANRSDLKQAKPDKVLLTMCSSAIELIPMGCQGCSRLTFVKKN